MPAAVAARIMIARILSRATSATDLMHWHSGDSGREVLVMTQRNSPLEPRELRAIRDYIRDGTESIRPRSEVEDIIRLAIASASRILPANGRRPDVALIGGGVHTTPAFEQRIVALFGD